MPISNPLAVPAIDSVLGAEIADAPPSAISLQLDWDAYFEAFKAIHGEPISYGQSKLLFPDGWTYYSRSKEGPEYPPPTDRLELLRMQRDYWKLRHALCRHEYNELTSIITNLRALQRSHHIPLQHTILVRDEAGQIQRMTQELNIDELEFGRLLWLKQDMQVALGNIKNYQKELEHYDRLKHAPNVGNYQKYP